MKKYGVLLVSALAIILWPGCDDDFCLPKGTPDCIEEKVKDFKDEACTESEVVRYDFQNKKVYLFDQRGCPDGTGEVYDETCTLICTLGGISGEILCNGDTFNTAATNGVLVWQKK